MDADTEKREAPIGRSISLKPPEHLRVERKRKLGRIAGAIANSAALPHDPRHAQKSLDSVNSEYPS